MNFAAVAAALVSAALFGLSTPVAKLLVGVTDPWLLAGLFYLGAGLGLAILRSTLRLAAKGSESPLARGDLPWLAGATLFGGVIGPILLLVGLTRTDGATGSLLLTTEGVATALIGWFAFRENFDRRIAIGMGFIVLGSLLLAWQGDVGANGLAGPLAVIGACIAWGLDNNLTRKVSLSDPMQIAMVKGLVAGPVSAALALWNGASLPSFSIAIAACSVGFLGYGISLALFVVALRHLGTARASAYFATAPFLGAAAAIPMLGEAVTIPVTIAGAFMALGVWLHLTERHEHEHEHDPLTHSHRHVHDEHHLHGHGPADPPGEPHSHRHVHVQLRHRHAHVPDAHHRHRH